MYEFYQKQIFTVIVVYTCTWVHSQKICKNSKDNKILNVWSLKLKRQILQIKGM